MSDEQRAPGSLERAKQTAAAVDDVLREVQRARNKHGDVPFHSYHEGFAVILEEVDELKAEVWKSKHNKPALRAEAIQVAAMALRFVSELCVPEPERAGSCPARLDVMHEPCWLTKGHDGAHSNHEETWTDPVPFPLGSINTTVEPPVFRNTPPAEVSLQRLVEAMSAQPCGCDMGCKPKPHHCERHRPIEPNLYQDKVFDDAECEHTKEGYGKCWRPKNHPGSHANAQHLWVESPLCR